VMKMKINFRKYRWLVILYFVFIFIYASILIFPSLLMMFFFYLSITAGKKRSIGISLFRTGYALLGIATYPLLYFEPMAFLSMQLTNKESITNGYYISFLIFYRLFFLAILPIGCYLSAYLLSILDMGGYLLPILLLFFSIGVMFFASIISSSLFSVPIILLFTTVLLLHIIFFSRKSVRAQFRTENLPMGINAFYHIYGLVGFMSIYFYTYILEDLQYFADLSSFHIESVRLVWGVAFGILCLLSSSLLSRLNIWGYRLPILALLVAIFLRGNLILYPLFACHLVYFNSPAVKHQFLKNQKL